MYYKSISITKRTRTATALVVVAAIASVLMGGSIGESAHLAFAHNGKRAIGQPTNIDQKTECLTAGGNSPIDSSCNNTVITHNTNTGGIGGARGGTGDDGAIEQPTNIDQKAVCETAGGNSPIDSSCNNTAISDTTNTGGIGGARGGAGDDGAIGQPTNIHQKTECLTAGGNSGIQGSCLNAGGTTTSNMGGINTNMGSSTNNMGSSSTIMGSSTNSMSSIKLPFGGFP